MDAKKSNLIQNYQEEELNAMTFIPTINKKSKTLKAIPVYDLNNNVDTTTPSVLDTAGKMDSVSRERKTRTKTAQSMYKS